VPGKKLKKGRSDLRKRGIHFAASINSGNLSPSEHQNYGSRKKAAAEEDRGEGRSHTGKSLIAMRKQKRDPSTTKVEKDIDQVLSQVNDAGPS